MLQDVTRLTSGDMAVGTPDRLQAMEAMEQELSKPVNTPIVSRPQAGNPEGKPKTGRASDEYRKAMLTALRSNFKQVSNVLQEGVDTDGGYLVPDEYDSRLIDTLGEENIMRKLATTITTSGEHKINIAATKPAASWIEEGAALTFSNATFSQMRGVPAARVTPDLHCQYLLLFTRPLEGAITM